MGTIAFITFCILRALCILHILYIVVCEFTFIYSNYKYKWIEREWRLLEALLEDFDEVSKSVNQITQEANQPLDSELIQAGISVALNEREKDWIREARKVVYEATRCAENFENLRNRKNSPKWFVYVFVDLVPMVDVAFRMKSLNNFFGKKEICASDIYGSLEQSRSRVRSLQDRSIVDDQIEHKSGELISSLKITENPDVRLGMDEQTESIIVHLQLLHAFMKDLQPLKLESQMETSWVLKANEIIYTAKDAFDTFNTTANRNWLPEINNWWARWKLKEEMMHVGTLISDLIEMKERYGFNFIRRHSSISPYQSPQQQTFQYQTTDDKDLLSAVNNIRYRLIQLPKTSKKSLPHVSSQLEDVYRLLTDTKAVYASNFRNACLEQLKKMASEAEEYSLTHMEDSGPKLLSEIIRINDAVNLLQRCIRVYSIEVRADSCSVVGLEEDIHKLVSRLIENSEHRSIISIVGMKGIGKTTLAKKVYNHSTIAKHFEVRCWVSVPQDSDENVLFASVGNQVLETKEKLIGKDYWIKKVRDFLKDKLYLVVLDNVLSNEAIYTLKTAFPKLTNGSKIVLTTRNKAIASNADQNSNPHQLRLRTKEESWEFFTQMMRGPSEMEPLVKEVVERSGGLPLAILRLAYLLWGKKVTSEKLVVFEQITQARNKIPWLYNLAGNKEELQFHPILSKCFCFFQLFSRDFEIPVRRIVATWIAQGLVQQRGGDEIPENVAYEYLSELIGRNMIQVVQRKPNGKVKTCCLPTTVRDLWLKGKGNSRKTRSWSSISRSFDSQLAFHFDDNDASFHHIHGLNTNLPNVMQSESHPHSILIFDTREGNKPREEIGKFLCWGIADGFLQQLQVLDLEHVLRPQLPRNIGKLKQLAYLGLRRTYLETIPEYVGNLVNLQTLDLKHTYVRTLPPSIWKLKKLRHLYLNESCRMLQPTAISMRNLQIFSGAFVDKSSPLKDGLSKLNNLRKLGLAFQLTPPEQKVLETSIVKLTNLESLKLRFINENRGPQHLKLEGILDLKKLSSLHLFGTLGKPSIINALPESLTHLTLSASGIEEDPMPKLGMLPNLRSLSLYSGSYQGTDMVCFKNGFPLLLVLKLWNLGTLKKLDVQEGAMQKLRKLEIRSCRNLAIATGLTQLRTLKEFEVS